MRRCGGRYRTNWLTDSPYEYLAPKSSQYRTGKLHLRGFKPIYNTIRRKLASPARCANEELRPSPLATSLPQAGCRGRSPRRGYRGSPPVPENVGGWAGETTAQAKPDPPPKEGAGHNKTLPSHPRQHPLAKYELLCYDAPMKWAAGPLLLLGACRIHEHCGLTIENGRGAEGTTQGARPSEEGLGPERPPL